MIGRVALCLSLSLPVAGGLATAAAAQEFSADTVSGAAGTAIGEAPGKIYVSNGKVRMERQGKSDGVILIDRKANTGVVLMPSRKAYIDMKEMGAAGQVFMPLDPNDPCPQWQAAMKSVDEDEGWSCKRIGSETVDGRSTIKYEMNTATKHDIGWLDPKLKFMVKTQSSEGYGMELRNIHEGAQVASLFEIPADYQKMDVQQMMERARQQRGGGKP